MIGTKECGGTTEVTQIGPGTTDAALIFDSDPVISIAGEQDPIASRLGKWHAELLGKRPVLAPV